MASNTSPGKFANMKSSSRAGTSADELSTGGASRHIDRASATSPSAVSSSTDEEVGGARLDAQIDGMSLDDSPSGSTYAPPHTRPGPGAPNFSRGLRHMPSTRGSPGFQVGRVPDDGDVFMSPVKQTGTRLSPLKIEESPRNDRSFGVSGYQEITSPMSGGTGGFDTPLRPLRTQASDLGSRHQVGGVDAQSFYPSTACVFVANLPEGVRDNRLEAEVTRHFSRFGVVFVKIRRDQKNMPFAFCQYTNDEDARAAMTEGKGTIVHGRACRTEMVKANRAYIMYNCNGGHLDVDEARKALAAFGPLSKCKPLDSRMQEAMNLGNSVLIEFTSFDPSRDVQAAFRHHASYRVTAYDPKKAFQAPKVDADEAWLQRYEVERRSIFIGNLPVDHEDVEGKIRSVLDDISDVVNVQVIQKEGKNGHPTVFSFVEFARPDMADMAVKRLSGSMIFGNNVRVERKASRDTSAREPRRVRSNMVMSDTYRSPARDQPASSGPQSIQRRAMENSTQANESTIPLTPMRPSVGQSEPINGGSPAVAPGAAPMAPPYWMPFNGQGYASPNYTTSPYGHQVPTSPYSAPPQGTPQGFTSPYGPYYPAAYSWASSYMQDPNLAAAAYNHTYGQMPIPVNQTGEEAPETPTKTAGAATGEVAESQGEDVPRSS